MPEASDASHAATSDSRTPPAVAASFGNDPQSTVDVASLRRSYGGQGLHEDEVAADPIAQFRVWFADVVAAGLVEPNAMILSTAAADGTPSARIVLLKGVDERGFVFYTNYESRKARELEANPRAALTFPWHALQRQVRVEGRVERVSRDETEEYFASRPHGSRVGAWASPQSQVVTPESLASSWAAATERFPDGSDVPAPEHWGGYRVVPQVVEFWVGRPSRMHDRLRYGRPAGGGDWQLDRLAP